MKDQAYIQTSGTEHNASVKTHKETLTLNLEDVMGVG
jgi:hypothetical protein